MKTLVVLVLIATYSCVTNAQMQLTQPVDNAVVTSMSPMFSWFYAPPKGDFKVSYQIQVFENVQELGRLDVVATNQPICSKEIGQASSWTYDFSCLDLDRGKEYLWRVSAWNGDQLLSTSVPFLFRYEDKTGKGGPAKQDSLHETLGFPLIQSEVNSGFYVYGKEIRFRYDNLSADTMVHFSVQSLSDAKVVIPMDSFKVHYRENYVVLNTKDLKLKGGTGKNGQRKNYLITVTDIRRNTYKLRFIIL
jgi:hypothetical protein